MLEVALLYFDGENRQIHHPTIYLWQEFIINSCLWYIRIHTINTTLKLELVQEQISNTQNLYTLKNVYDIDY